jgi:hypothetical protein
LQIPQGAARVAPGEHRKTSSNNKRCRAAVSCGIVKPQVAMMIGPECAVFWSGFVKACGHSGFVLVSPTVRFTVFLLIHRVQRASLLWHTKNSRTRRTPLVLILEMSLQKNGRKHNLLFVVSGYCEAPRVYCTNGIVLSTVS